MLTNKIDGAFLDAHPSVKAVANMAVGYNNIDVPACTARNVGCSNTPGVLNNATAEIAFVLILSTARRTGESERYLRARKVDRLGHRGFHRRRRLRPDAGHPRRRPHRQPRRPHG